MLTVVPVSSADSLVLHPTSRSPRRRVVGASVISLTQSSVSPTFLEWASLSLNHGFVDLGDTVQVTSGAMAHSVGTVVYLYEKTGKYLRADGRRAQDYYAPDDRAVQPLTQALSPTPTQSRMQNGSRRSDLRWHVERLTGIRRTVEHQLGAHDPRRAPDANVGPCESSADRDVDVRLHRDFRTSAMASA